MKIAAQDIHLDTLAMFVTNVVVALFRAGDEPTSRNIGVACCAVGMHPEFFSTRERYEFEQRVARMYHGIAEDK